MTKFDKLSLPLHRHYLVKFWRHKSYTRLHKVNFLIEKLTLHKIWKEGLEPGQEVLPNIEADANNVMARIREAILERDVSFLWDLFEAVKVIKEAQEDGLRQDYRRKIIMAFSQLYLENRAQAEPRHPVWVEATEKPTSIALAPHGYLGLSEPNDPEPTKEQLWDRVCANGTKIPRRTYDSLLKELGLSGPGGLRTERGKGAPRGKRKFSEKDFRK